MKQFTRRCVSCESPPMLCGSACQLNLQKDAHTRCRCISTSLARLPALQGIGCDLVTLLCRQHRERKVHAGQCSAGALCLCITAECRSSHPVLPACQCPGSLQHPACHRHPRYPSHSTLSAKGMFALMSNAICMMLGICGKHTHATCMHAGASAALSQPLLDWPQCSATKPHDAPRDSLSDNRRL